MAALSNADARLAFTWILVFRPSAELAAAPNAIAASCAAALASRSNCSIRSSSVEAAAAIVATIGGVSLDAPNAYSDDDQSIYQKAINSLPYFGLQTCFGSPFQFQPNEQVLRDEFACLMIKAINAGTTQNLTGSEDKYSDIGASKWQANIKTLASKKGQSFECLAFLIARIGVGVS